MGFGEEIQFCRQFKWTKMFLSGCEKWNIFMNDLIRSDSAGSEKNLDVQIINKFLNAITQQQSAYSIC